MRVCERVLGSERGFECVGERVRVREGEWVRERDERECERVRACGSQNGRVGALAGRYRDLKKREMKRGSERG